ncbi:MAG TPA: nucleoside hydrolase [Roseiarcus sp.]|nr:nucleoside hydrolase [Roseiarcus sp.]
MRDFLIDTDTASDDAVAIIMALSAPDVRVLALTTVAGNVGLEQATRNALYTAQVCGANVPIFKGAAAPLTRAHEDAHWFHGRDGLGDRNYPPPARSAERDHAVAAIIRLCHDTPGLALVTLGPLTNVALAVAEDPTIVGKVARCVVMGGAPCCEGNVSPAAEYNIWVDPEAARMVFRSGLPIEMVGWQVSRGESVLSDAEIADIRALGTAKARFAIECNGRAKEAYFTQTGESGLSLADPTAMAVALDRSIGTAWSRHLVEIECASELTRGMTIVDRLNVAHDANNAVAWKRALDAGVKTDVCWTIDAARFKKMMIEALR